MPLTRQNALDRFIAAAERAVELSAYGPTMTDLGARSALQGLKDAAPIAEAIALMGNPLAMEHDPLDAYIAKLHEEVRQQAEAESDPDHECELAAATERATYFVALATGLLVADRV